MIIVDLSKTFAVHFIADYSYTPFYKKMLLHTYAEVRHSNTYF